jgi:hypothetical protein
MPEVEINDKGKIDGSFKVKGGINIDCSGLKSKEDVFLGNNIKINGSKHLISRGCKIKTGIERNFSIDNGVHMGEVMVKLNTEGYEEITLFGTSETLGLIKKNDEILMLNQEE